MISAILAARDDTYHFILGTARRKPCRDLQRGRTRGEAVETSLKRGREDVSVGRSLMSGLSTLGWQQRRIATEGSK
jgi:hypothetical protein